MTIFQSRQQRWWGIGIGGALLVMAVSASADVGRIGNLIGSTRLLGGTRLLNVVLNDTAGTAVSPSVDATHNAAVKATGPQLMGECDDVATGTVNEGNAGRGRVDCTTRALLTTPISTAVAANGATTYYLTSAATTNATNVKASAGNVYTIRVVNTTSTLYYLRLYNLTTAPTCSSATGFIESIPVPHASGAGAGLAIDQSVGQGFATGIGFCLTGGGGSTDNTAAATGVYLTLLYR